MSDNDFSISDNINNIFDKLESFVKTNTVVGEPMNVGDATIIPFIDISFGLGTGGGGGTDDKGNKGTGGGAGSGAKISPSAILVIKGDRIEVLPIKKAGTLEKIMDMVPDLVKKVKDQKSDDE